MPLTFKITERYRAYIFHRLYIEGGMTITIAFGVLLRQVFSIGMAWFLAITLTVILAFFIDYKIRIQERSKQVNKSVSRTMTPFALYIFCFLFGAPAAVLCILVSRHPLQTTKHMWVISFMAMVQLLFLSLYIPAIDDYFHAQMLPVVAPQLVF